MRFDSSTFFNFNQMLVVSVFVHLLGLTIVMFLPKTDWVKQKIRPVFMVDLVELPGLPGSQPGDLQEEGKEQPMPPPPESQTAEQPQTQTPSTGQPPVSKQQTAVKPPVTQKPTMQKPVAQKPLAQLQMEDTGPKAVTPPETRFSSGKKASKFEDLPFTGTTPKPKTETGSSKSTATKQELDQLAKLPPATKQQSGQKPPPSVLEQNLKELDGLKKRNQIPSVETKKGPARVNEALEGFESLQMEQGTPTKTPQPPTKFKKEDTSLEEQLFASLAERKIKTRQPDATVASERELMKQLEALQNIKKTKEPVVIEKKTDKGFENLVVQQMETTQEVLDKIASLGKGKEHKVEISFEVDEANDQARPVEFKSRIWKEVQPLTSGKGTQGTGTGADAKKTYVYQGPVGQAQAADPLSKYVGKIYQEIYKNWRNPIGAGQNKVRVSFYIFRAGNIDQPKLVQSSGDDQLDKLALLAVKDSAPFPAFPSALKEPNLHLTINFKYVRKQ